MIFRVLLIALLILAVNNLSGQLIQSKNSVSISTGNLIYGGSDNLFFPQGINKGGKNFRVDYLHTILPWMKIGIESSFYLPGVSVSDFANISTANEKLITSGIQAALFLPYRESGWRNHFNILMGVSPVAVFYTGERNVVLDNEVWNKEDNVQESSTLTLKGPKTGLGLSLTPSVEYQFTQSFGVKLTFNTLFTSLKSDLITEHKMIYSLDIGLTVALSKNKRLNY